MATAAYVELHCHSYFSLLDGASSPAALAERAAALGYSALALTDHDGLYGAVRFWRAARQEGMRPLIGAEVTLDDGGHLTLLAETQRGYANLCRLISAGQLAGPEQGRRAGQKGQPRLTLETLAAHAAGLICLSGCRRGPVAAALLARDEARARQAAGRLRDIFSPDCFFIEVQRHYLPTDARLVAGLVDLARELGLAVVATNDVHHADRAGQRLHDLLTAVRHHATLPEALAAGLLHPNSERYLKSPAEMAVLFADLPAALRNTIAIAERCQVSLDFAAQRLPAFPVPPGHTPDSYLSSLCHAALPGRCQPVTAPAQAQLAHELAVIAGTGLAGYFLVVWDIVRLARERGIRCQGRGSAANSLVAYLLGITPVDPLRHHLLFERFLSAGARTMPDIDVDFAADRREEVIQYVYERYGEAHVGMVCNVVTYRARSALRDVAKALAFPPDVAGHEVRRQRPARSAGRGEVADVVDRAAQALETRAPAAAAASLASASSEDVHLPWAVLAEVLCEMEGVPRHLSIHVGGLLVTAAPLLEVVPLERATMPGRVVVQWDKDSVEDAGLIKIDLLGLRTLGMVEEALSYIRERGSALDLDRLPLDDPAVYALLQRADTVGCFQVESRAQAQMLPRLQPQCFADLVVAVALVRPGPIQGNMVHPYLRRRQGLEPVEYLHPALEPALAETLGVILFQEQVIRVALAVAGFAPAEADALRRALGRESAAELAALRARFLTGAQAQGLDEAAAAAIYQQLTAFAGYGFCKSHAAAFALLAYQTLYLKAHFPAEFTCALLNHQPLGFYSPAVLVGDAGRHGVPVRGPDANRSQAVCTLEGSGPRRAVRLGLRYVHGLGEVWPARLVARREGEAFRDLRDLCRRTRLPKSLVENLVRAGALDGLGRARRDLVWELGALDYQEEDLDLAVPVVPAALPALSDAERLGWEYDLLGLAPGDHVLSLYRAALRRQGVLSSGALAAQRDGQAVRVAGLVVVRQRPPTAQGHVFLTLEDEDGLVNLIVRPGVYERYRDVLRHAPLLLAEGRLQREENVVSVLVARAAALEQPGPQHNHLTPGPAP